jgi:quercetin dioxygenase-like cupin family protein
MFDNPLLDRLAGYDGPASQQPVWIDHPKFAGVRMRQLASGAESEGRFTTLLVSVAPNGRMLAHRHEAEVEQHVVLSGDGQLELDGRIRDYRPGCLAVIPKSVEHSVTAGERGMVILALFSPALP